MGSPAAWPGFRKKLHGHIALVRGNHDRAADFMVDTVGVESALENVVVLVDGVRIWLNHYPLAEPETELDHRGRAGDIRVRSGVANVGVDVWDFRPVSLERLQEAVDATGGGIS